MEAAGNSLGQRAEQAARDQIDPGTRQSLAGMKHVELNDGAREGELRGGNVVSAGRLLHGVSIMNAGYY